SSKRTSYQVNGGLRPTLRRSQRLRDLLITKWWSSGSNSRLWRSQSRDFGGAKRFLHLFSCAIASIFIVPTSNFSRVTTGTSPTFALSIICSASATVWSSKQQGLFVSICASTGSVLGSCPKPPTFRFIWFFDTVPNNL